MNETIIPIVAFLGIFVGILIAKYTREEIRNNRKYLFLLGKTITAILIFVVLIYSKNFPLLFIGVLIGYLSAYVLSEFLFLGLQLGLGLFLQKEISLISSFLVFMYSLVYGSLIRTNNLSFMKIFILFVMFFLPFSLFLFNSVLMTDVIIGFISGGLTRYILGNEFALK